MPGNEEEAGSSFLMELNPREWFQNTDVLWGMAATCTSHRQGAAIPWNLAQGGSLSHLNSEGVSCTGSFSALTSTCR